MNPRTFIYGAVCLIALIYLAVANARGYVPFLTPATKSIDRAATQFHK